MSEYRVDMWEQCGGTHTEIIDASDIDDAREQAEELLRDWVAEGEYGIDGAMVDARWTLLDMDGNQIDDGSITVEIEPDEDEICRRAGGDPSCEHDWDNSDEGGCDQNPGWWNVGGDRLVRSARCTRCSIRRIEYIPGCQRDPGEHRTVTFELPEE